MTDAHIPLESEYWQKGFRWIAGVDEAGRGPLAGPVVAAACLIPYGVELKGIRDSKTLSKSRREKLYWDIVTQTLVGVGVVDEKEIDRINIFQASLLAMRKAVLALPKTPDMIFVDGKFPFDIPIPQIPVIKGDQKLVSVGAASIIAKVTRDAMMEKLDLEYPQYGFKQHKGYPTPEHITALSVYGPSPIHRMSFRPVEEAANNLAAALMEV